MISRATLDRLKRSLRTDPASIALDDKDDAGHLLIIGTQLTSHIGENTAGASQTCSSVRPK